MAVFKCKMCGGELEIQEGLTVCECEYCGTTQTIPSLDNEKKLNLFNRANRLRFNSEFDKAAAIYENIVAEFPEEAEGYWGLVLCNYGIEYVDDPATGKKIPTCHRAAFESVKNDENFELALEYADVLAQKVYRDEAREIDRIMSEILKISKSEEPYDIFICYKETDEKGDRTIDSVIAQDVYDALTDKGYRVFFSRITLEDKIGREYEPYIFAALNSAKVMLAFGTKYEYFHAVWVKNEWSRFLKLMAKDKTKSLVPCYKDLDAYDMPDEFKALQAQDMGKVGAIQDLVRGVEKLLPKNAESTTEKETVVVSADNSQVAPLLKRVFMFLEDGDYKSANEYSEKVLDIDPENSEAYLGKLMVDLKVEKKEDLVNCKAPFDKNANFKKALRFGDETFVNELNGYIKAINERNIENAYQTAVSTMKKFKDEKIIKALINDFKALGDYKDSKALCEECKERVEAVKKEKDYKKAVSAMKKAKTVKEFKDLADDFKKLGDYEDSKALCEACKEKAEELDKKLRPILVEKRNKLSKLGQLVSVGFFHTVGIKSDGTVFAVGGNQFGQCDVQDWTDIVAVSVGLDHTVGLKSDGTVVAVGKNLYRQCDVQDWTDIVAISAGNKHTVGLKTDGTVVAVGENDGGQCNVREWTDIAAVSIGLDHTVGLKSDGTVVATEYTGIYYRSKCDVQDWTDIVAVSVGDYHTVGLKSDGTVVAIGENDYGKCNVREWTDIVAVSTGDNHTVGLKSDGTVVAVGENDDGQCDVQDWTDIVAVYTGDYHTVGLKSDGTVVAVGKNDDGQCDVQDWTDIVAVYTGSDRTVGLKSDGTVVAVGKNNGGQCNVGKWRLFKSIETFEEEQKEEREEARKQQAQKAQYRSQGLCQHCGGQLKGLFSKKCANCGKPKDY